MTLQGKGEHVLLTGANGFVASHILAILLEVQSSLVVDYLINGLMIVTTARVYCHCHGAVWGQSRRYHQDTSVVEGQSKLYHRIWFYFPAAIWWAVYKHKSSFYIYRPYCISSKIWCQRYPKRDDWTRCYGVRKPLQIYVIGCLLKYFPGQPRFLEALTNVEGQP